MSAVKYRGKVDGVWWYVSPDDNPNLFGQFWHVVDRETVGQSIGEVDKAGKDIYEGDIVRLYYGDGSYYERPVEVKFGLHRVGFDSDCATTGPALGFYFSPYPYDDPEYAPEGNPPMGVGMYSWDDTLEIIGNHYDNPELLQKAGEQ